MFCFLYATLKCDRAWVVPPCSCSEGVAPFALRRSLKEPWPVKEVIWAWFCDLQIAFWTILNSFKQKVAIYIIIHLTRCSPIAQQGFIINYGSRIVQPPCIVGWGWLQNWNWDSAVACCCHGPMWHLKWTDLMAPGRERERNKICGNQFFWTQKSRLKMWLVAVEWRLWTVE